MNKVILVGRLGADPEVKTTSNGNTVCNLSIATDEQWTDKVGQRQKRTEWHKVVVWGRTAENCGAYLGKGSMVYVEGSLTTEKWADKDGNDRYTTKVKAQTVQFLDSKGQRRAAPAEEPPGGGYEFGQPDDNLPF